nr:hypothetical protein BaRGS_004762 [Batillaria attramentaria]
MAQAQASKNDSKTHRMETRKKPSPAHLSPQTSADMTYEDPSNVALATQTLVDFAMTKGHTIHSLTHMTRSQLAEFLRDFYGKAKSRIDESSMGLKDIRAGLHKFFLEEIAVDILRDKTFELANATFDLALRTNAPRKCHRMRIEMEDLRKIYLSEAMELNTPESLQNKAFFDVNLYICNRSKDCLRLMKKEDFEVASDINGRRYVCLKDPAKFGGPESYNGDRMYERPGDPRCPVKSFLKYVTHLHPMNDNFWQRPKRNVTPADYVWYDHSPIGSSTLNKIMQRISLMAGMCDSYTTHSIRFA